MGGFTADPGSEFHLPVAANDSVLYRETPPREAGLGLGGIQSATELLLRDLSGASFFAGDAVTDRTPRRRELRRTTVYNLTVEDAHTYVAGGFRVHNDSRVATRIGGMIGGQLASQLYSTFGGKNPFVGVVVSGVGTTIGQYVGNQLHHTGLF
ncbi:MAG: hypothetical protein MI861_27835, partial [Pirellulales bacterium]|nr:hypothetical protein [Pirellulales bacterium]